jgi:hypothetical protein
MPNSWTETYQRHFQKYFNKPFDIQAHHGPDCAGLKLAMHDWALSGFGVYASMGLADFLVRNEEEDFGEVILFTDVRDQEVPRLFVSALFFILANAIPLSSRFAIGFAKTEPAFAKRFGKTALYYKHPAIPDTFFANDPYGEGKIGRDTFDKVRKGNAFGRVYQAFFITSAEDKFLDAFGADAFEQKLQKQFDDELAKEGCHAPPDAPGEKPKDSAKMKENLAKFDEYRMKMQDYAQHAARVWSKVLSVRRPSCV